MTSLGLALLVIGAVVAVAEAHYPTHGIAGGTGVLVMAVGAVLAITGLGAGVLLALLAGGALAAGGRGGVVLSVRKGGAVRHRRVRTGAEGIIGHLGVVRSWTDASAAAWPSTAPCGRPAGRWAPPTTTRTTRSCTPATGSSWSISTG